MAEQHYRPSRRRLVWSALAGTGGAVIAPLAAGAARAQTPVDESGASRAEAPKWVFLVDAVQDPYPGTLQAPSETPAGTRVVAVEVEVSNESDQALAFTTIDVRLRDLAGVEYRGGGAVGSEPMINPRNLNPGERSRGWVWFILPADSEPTEIVYVAPPPQFRIAWPD